MANSSSVDNLMMAGKHISVSRVVGSNVKQSANGAQHGIAVGCAAALCKKCECAPQEVRGQHMDELREIVAPYITGAEPSPTPEQAEAIKAQKSSSMRQGVGLEGLSRSLALEVASFLSIFLSALKLASMEAARALVLRPLFCSKAVTD
ncbi:MAG: FAD-dependent oxidoreductase [Raoultibacter sp.]